MVEDSYSKFLDVKEGDDKVSVRSRCHSKRCIKKQEDKQPVGFNK